MKKNQPLYCFNIITPGKSGKTYELFAGSPEEYHEWIRAISHNILNSRLGSFVRSFVLLPLLPSKCYPYFQLLVFLMICDVFLFLPFVFVLSGTAPKPAMMQMAALGEVANLHNHTGWLYRKSKRKYVRLDGMALSYATEKPPKGKLEAVVSLFGCTVERQEGWFVFCDL